MPRRSCVKYKDISFGLRWDRTIALRLLILLLEAMENKCISGVWGLFSAFRESWKSLNRAKARRRRSMLPVGRAWDCRPSALGPHRPGMVWHDRWKSKQAALCPLCCSSWCKLCGERTYLYGRPARQRFHLVWSKASIIEIAWSPKYKPMNNRCFEVVMRICV